MQTKFKKGDRVRAVEDCSRGNFEKGTKGVVDRVYEDGNYCVRFEGKNILLIAYRNEIELATEETSPRFASDMTIREQMIKDIYCSLLISEQNTSMKNICEYLQIEIEEYKWAIHFPAFIRKMATEQADALINALNEKP